MKKTIFTIAMILLSLCCYAQYDGSNTKNTVASPDSNVNFRLYQTNNRWTFLKLDTRNGVITHVQYNTDGDAMELSLKFHTISRRIKCETRAILPLSNRKHI